MSSTCKMYGASRLADLKMAISMSKLSRRAFFFKAAEQCNPSATIGHVVGEVNSYTSNPKHYPCPVWLVEHVLNVLSAHHDSSDASAKSGIGAYIGNSAGHR